MDSCLTDDAKAIILLCGVLGKAGPLKPLTQTEYSALAQWLHSQGMRPADLLQVDSVNLAAKSAKIDPERLSALLGRGVQLGFAVEEWQRSGVWIISRGDEDYPARYKKHLREKSPPLLFGVGDRSLLQGGGVAIVGSRNVDAEGEAFTRQVAARCARNQIPVVSGGARGVDQFAMTAALDAGGVAIGILAENLLKKSLAREARHAIADGRLLLISPYHPRARFNVGTAMGRNKLIYAMADCGLVVSAVHKKGGTWAGAQEELKRAAHIPVFVRLGGNVPSGNAKLLDLGAVAWPEHLAEDMPLWPQLTAIAASPPPSESKAELPPCKEHEAKIDSVPEPEPTEKAATPAGAVETPPTEVVGKLPRNDLADVGEPSTERTLAAPKDAVYHAVLPLLIDYLREPRKAEQVATALDLVKTQANKWLKRAEAEGVIEKLEKPARYVAGKGKQLKLL